MEKKIITSKDFTADNVVHPNDLGMRLIAQTIADAIGER